MMKYYYYNSNIILWNTVLFSLWSIIFHNYKQLGDDEIVTANESSLSNLLYSMLWVLEISCTRAPLTEMINSLLRKPGGKVLLCVAAEMVTFVWKETWDTMTGVEGGWACRVEMWLIDLFRGKCQLEYAWMTPWGFFLKAKLMATSEKSSSVLCPLLTKDKPQLQILLKKNIK